MLPSGYRHQSFSRIDSTNAEALRLAASGEAGPLWITAQVQEAGRGRQGRRWVSEAGNLYASLLIDLAVGLPVMGQVSFVTALAVCDAVSAGAPAIASDLRLKWPNDVLLGGLKLAGILLEGTGDSRIVIGCGINLRHKPDAGSTRLPAVTLADHGVQLLADTMLAALATALDTRLAQWRGGEGFPSIRADWMARAYGLGREVALEAAGEAVTGVFEGIAGDGALMLRDKDGKLRHLHAGDVRYLTDVNGMTT